MSIEQGINDRWEGHQPLSDLMPSANFQAGYIEPIEGTERPAALPWVRLERTGEPQRTRASGGRVGYAANFQFETWSETLVEAKAIADAINDRYSGAEFDYEGGAVIDVKQQDRSETKQADDTWLVTTLYRFRATE